ncbi:alpha/beta superfamily hydrolase [Halalkaliarchaeum desulfuricum]|uniref:Alpha/beta superfamily hydrolase n=1 Tax=Halalkaliarchaeum desulfuricum TaxID=2055893 RepID=A0A343TG63_9EURY|nr:alpha/beta fold hydrolase [Halalkaliarchaeum desulfuricum]AUX08085.1 alpha/beta superfamily hydrolase [Halalkaliarchaeum desulfuricum]
MTRRRPINRSQRSLRRPARERYAVRQVGFDSDGTRARGSLYLPDRTDTAPVVVMAPGLGAERSFGYPAVAERFAEAGYAAFLFDYRHHGESDGRPRRLVSTSKQLADYDAAIDRVRRIDELDAGRIAVWGHSLSGGHALVTAADRSDVRAAVTIAPFTDGRIFLRTRSIKYLARATALGARDALGGLRDRLVRRIPGGNGADERESRRARRVPIVGDTDRTAVISEPGTRRAYLDLVDRHSEWENATPARCLLDLVRYRPIERFEDVDVDAFVFVPEDDRILPPARMTAAVENLDRATVVRAPADHFSVLAGDFEETVAYQLAFLNRAVGKPERSR